MPQEFYKKIIHPVFVKHFVKDLKIALDEADKMAISLPRQNRPFSYMNSLWIKAIKMMEHRRLLSYGGRGVSSFLISDIKLTFDKTLSKV